MLQESVLSATYICSLQIPGNRLIQTLLIDSKSQVCVMTHGSGGADAILPFTARRRIKEASPQIKKCGRKTISNTNSSHPGPAHSTRAASLSSCWGSPQPEGQEQEQEGSCRVVCRWCCTGMKSCQVWQHQNTPVGAASPLCKE